MATNEFGGMIEVQRRFECWRRSRGGTGRIPQELWRLAAEAAVKHGVDEAAARLRLDVERLKQWVRKTPRPAPVSASPFVELAPLAFGSPPECTLEVEDPAGRKLRVSLKGDAVTQALAFGQLLLRSQP